MICKFHYFLNNKLHSFGWSIQFQTTQHPNTHLATPNFRVEFRKLQE